MQEYNRVVSEINLDAIGYNIRKIREITDKNAKIMAVVKADAYGHGAVEVAKVALYNGADALAVAITDEGIQIRENNIKVPVLVLGYTPEMKLEDCVKYDLIQTVYNLEMAKNISNVAKRLNKIAKIHIKAETGMGRLGFLPSEEAYEDIIKISQMENIKIDGVFTHFATSDSKDKSFTYEQARLFKTFISELEKRNIEIPVKHCANSAAIMDLPQLSFNMVRAGIILYGMYPSDEVNKQRLDIKPAMSLKTQISYIKDEPCGVSIGYGRTYFTKRNSRVATIPVGYADGYSRALSNKGRVLVRGKYAPIVGRICMDQMMIDITDIPNTQIGDEVVLIGKQGENAVTVEEIADLTGTINYEVVCMIGKRIPRVYIKNNAVLKTVSYL